VDAPLVTVEDDGAGGAARSPGSGLAGLHDRIAALDGTLTIASPPGGGTRICAEIPGAMARTPSISGGARSSPG
jgi:signal transduction histidine kinase